MKKYWKSITIILITVLGIGTFYIQSYISALSLPDFKIETVEGDETFIENIVLVSEYVTDAENVDEYGYGYGQILYLTEDNTIYRNQLSLINEMKGIPETRERFLRDEYSSFFRGINMWNESIYEDEQYLVSADILYNSYRGMSDGVKVKYLNKENGQTESIDYPLSSNNHLIIDDIQVNGDTILVFAKQWTFREDGHAKEAAYLYKFDMNTNELITTEELYVVEAEPDQYVDISILHDSKSWSPNDYVVYRSIMQRDEAVQEYDVEDEFGDGERVQLEDNRLFAYEVATGEMKEVNLPESLRDRFVNYFDGSNLYYVTGDVDELKLAVYSLKEDKIINELEIEYTKYDNARMPGYYMLTVDDGYVYFHETLVTDEGTSFLQVIDTTTGEIVYKGKIVPEKSDLQFEMFIMRTEFQY